MKDNLGLSERLRRVDSMIARMRRRQLESALRGQFEKSARYANRVRRITSVAQRPSSPATSD